MKKFDEVKRKVSEFCQDHILGITATAAAGIWIAYFAFAIREIRNLDNNITDCADSLTYVLDPAKIAITVPDADHIDEAIKWIKENDVLNPLDYEEFQRIVDTFTELKNNKN
jgi:hypothetical protein